MRYRVFLAAVVLASVACGCGGNGSPAPEFPLSLTYEQGRPVASVIDAEGSTVVRFKPGMIRLARVSSSFEWDQGFLAVSRDEAAVTDFADAVATWTEDDGTVTAMLSEDGVDLAAVTFQPEQTGYLFQVEILPGSGDVNEVRFLLECGSGEAFYGFGGQNDAVDHRGHTIPIRSTEQGLGKDPDVPEWELSYPGHLHDTYFPLPYTLVATSGGSARAHGLILESTYRSRFLVCTDESPDTLEIQVDTDDLGGLRVLAGPTPADVVRQFTDHHYRPNPVPDWTFGPWVALFGDPAPVAVQADELDLHDIPLSAVWHMDYREYHHPDLPAMIAKIRGMGLRVLTYFNSFLDDYDDWFFTARDQGFMPHREDGSPYWVQWYDVKRSIVDFTDPNGWNFMKERLDFAWSLGLDGWMADYGEWVVPDMRFDNGMTGWEYGNIYPVDWARINDDALVRARPDGDAIFFSRSGFLDSNRYLKVVWAGDQQTDWDILDGIGSVIPYGTGLGLSGVSAFGHDIAGYTSLATYPSTKELYFRWTELGAWSPIMRTHRGNYEEYNWDWNKDQDTIDHFRRYALLHLRLAPYLVALHAEAVRSGLPAMRSLVLEFPEWEGARHAVHEFMLGPAFFVAPVIHEGAVTRSVTLPPGRWYRFHDGSALTGGQTIDEAAPLEFIPVYVRAGGIAVMTTDDVRRFEPDPRNPELPYVRDVQQRRLEILVGAGGSGRLELADGTVIAASGDSVTTVPTGIAECGQDESQWDTDCFVRSGQFTLISLRGNSAVELAGMKVSVTGGPSTRRYVVRVFGSAI